MPGGLDACNLETVEEEVEKEEDAAVLGGVEDDEAVEVGT